MNRSILIQMNEFYMPISWNIEDYIPSEKVNHVEMNKWCGTSLCCSIDGVYPIDLLKEEMANL